eukprot:scaffold44673_cov18-Tisochrysis_lutea.AAC.3
MPVYVFTALMLASCAEELLVDDSGLLNTICKHTAFLGSLTCGPPPRAGWSSEGGNATRDPYAGLHAPRPASCELSN